MWIDFSSFNTYVNLPKKKSLMRLGYLMRLVHLWGLWIMFWGSILGCLLYYILTISWCIARSLMIMWSILELCLKLCEILSCMGNSRSVTSVNKVSCFLDILSLAGELRLMRRKLRQFRTGQNLLVSLMWGVPWFSFFLQAICERLQLYCCSYDRMLEKREQV